MTQAEPELRSRRGRSRPHVWGPLWSLVCGALSAAPHPGLMLLARLTAAAFLTAGIWSRLWPSGQEEARPQPADAGGRRSSVIDLWMLFSLVLLINQRSVSWLVITAFLWVAHRLLRRKLPTAHLVADMVESTARIAMPGWLGWLAASTSRLLPPEQVNAMAPPSGVAAVWPQIGLPLAVWVAFTLVDFSVTAHGRSRAEPLWRGPLLLGAYVVLALALAVHGQSLAAAVITVFAATQLPMLGALDHGRRRWYAQATQPVAILALLTAAIALAVGAN